MTGDQITKTHASRSGDEDADDPRIVAAVQEYMSALDRGELLDRQQFLARHAAIAEPLSKCLDGLELVHRATANLRHESTPEFGWLPDQLPLGDFRVVREIGRGGMGVVYEAIQLSLGRRVALKVLSMAATLDPKHLARFKNEAHAAAQLHHTNIVPVYAVGTERGVHFYAMQLIDGYPLSALIEHLRQSKQTANGQSTRSAAASFENSTIDEMSPLPSQAEARAPETIPAAEVQTESISVTALSASYTNRASYFRNVAKLMRDAAAALEHAHQFGVIHRDIKPANLLLDGHGNLWITDFGLAQFQTDSQLTQTGDMLGTLRYMSPEQASGGRAVVDHRTDVYSLGATFYEFLSLKPVLKSGSRHELLRGIVDEEPQSLRAIDPRIPLELETIVLKSLAKSPAERYSTAGELADDLQRWLADKPILARRPTLLERAARWRRQHRALVSTAIAFLCLLSVGSLVATALILREQSKTKEAYEREMTEHAAAEKSFQLARDAVDKISQLAQNQRQSPSTRRFRGQILETALDFYQSFFDQRRDDRAASAALVAAKQRIARIFDELSVLDGFAPLALLGDHRVEEELALTTSQRSAIHQMHLGLHDDMEQIRKDASTPKSESREQLLEHLRADEEQIETLLNGDQFTRLRQIVLQVRQPFSFSDSEVIKQLALSEDQQKQINLIIDEERPSGPGVGLTRDSEGKSAKDIHDLRPADPGRGWPRLGGPPPGDEFDDQPPRGPKSHDGKGPDGFHPKGPPPPGEFGRGPGPEEFGRGPPPGGGKSMDGPIDRTVPKILEVLTAEQRAKWQEMIGAPLNYHVPLERIELPLR